MDKTFQRYRFSSIFEGGRSQIQAEMIWKREDGSNEKLENLKCRRNIRKVQ